MTSRRPTPLGRPRSDNDGAASRTSNIASIAEDARSLGSELSRPLIIGVSGFGGAGKTNLAVGLHELIPGSVVVTGDEFMRERQATKRSDDWSNMDRQRLCEDVLLPASTGDMTLIVEGLGLFHPDLMEHFDLRIWIDVDLDTATRRGMWRDENIWHNPQTDLWLGVWKPNDADYFRRFRPDRAAHVLYAPHISPQADDVRAVSGEALTERRHDMRASSSSTTTCEVGKG